MANSWKTGAMIGTICALNNSKLMTHLLKYVILNRLLHTQNHEFKIVSCSLKGSWAACEVFLYLGSLNNRAWDKSLHLNSLSGPATPGKEEWRRKEKKQGRREGKSRGLSPPAGHKSTANTAQCSAFRHLPEASGPSASQSSHGGVGLLSSPISCLLLVSPNQEASVPCHVCVVRPSQPGQPAHLRAQAAPGQVYHVAQKAFTLNSLAQAAWCWPFQWEKDPCLLQDATPGKQDGPLREMQPCRSRSGTRSAPLNSNGLGPGRESCLFFLIMLHFIQKLWKYPDWYVY